MRARIGPYRIVGTLGHGGMGVVYEGFHDGLQRRAAIKTLNPAQETDPDVLRRLRAEAQAQARLHHPNVVGVYDLIEDQGELFIALEYVEGTTLDVLLEERQGSGLPLAEALRLGGQLLTALEYVHRQGVIHRDIKPSNVILSEDQVKLTDFGIALLAGLPRQTAASVILGTPTYMSPEQFQGLEVDLRSDLYSTAVVLYEMLAGRPPFIGGTHLELMSHHLREEPEDLRALVPDLPAGVCEVVALGLRKEPGERYQTAGELLIALREGAAGFLPAVSAVARTPKAAVAAPRIEPTVLLPSQPPPLRPPEPPSAHPLRRRWLAAATLFLVLSGVGTYGLWRTRHAPLPPPSPTPIVSLAAPPFVPVPAGGTARSEVSGETVSSALEALPRPPKDPTMASIPKVAAQPPTTDTADAAQRELDQMRKELREKELQQIQEELRQAEIAQQELARIREEVRQEIAAVELDLAAKRFSAAEDRLDRQSDLVQSRRADLAPEGEAIRALRRQLTEAIVWERRLQTIQDLLEQGKYPEADSMAATLGKEPGVPEGVAARAAELSVQAKDELRKIWEGTKIGPTSNRLQKPPKPGGRREP